MHKAPGGDQPLPESLTWLLMTGEVPKDEQFRDLQNEIRSKGQLTRETEQFIANLPKDMHPMTQLSMAVMYLQSNSKFAAAYRNGIHKSKYWEVIYDDCIDLIAKLPRICALIYRHLYKVNKLFVEKVSFVPLKQFFRLNHLFSHVRLSLRSNYFV